MMTVITCTNREMMMNNVFHNYSIQTMKNKELIIILNKDEMNLDIWRNEAKKYPSVTVYQLPERMMVSECKNNAIPKAKYHYIAKFDDDDYYAPSYLQTSWDIFMKYPEADIVGKSSVYFYFQEQRLLCLFPSLNENTWTDHVIDSTLAFKDRKSTRLNSSHVSISYAVFTFSILTLSLHDALPIYDDDYYAPSYLQTSWDIFMKYPEADIVGKSSVYFYFQEQRLLCLFPSLNENTWTDHVIDSTLAF